MVFPKYLCRPKLSKLTQPITLNIFSGKPRPTRQITNLKIFNIGDFLPKIYTLVSSPPKPAKVFKTQVVERIIPRLQYVTPYDIEREYYKQTELYKYVKSE